MSEAITRPTMESYKAALLAASASGGFPSETSANFQTTPACCYLGTDGRKCAVGLLLPAEVATELDALKGLSGVGHDEVWEKVSPFVPEGISQMQLDVIQKAHDEISLKNRGLNLPWPHEEFAAKIESIFRGEETSPL